MIHLFSVISNSCQQSLLSTFHFLHRTLSVFRNSVDNQETFTDNLVNTDFYYFGGQRFKFKWVLGGVPKLKCSRADFRKRCCVEWIFMNISTPDKKTRFHLQLMTCRRVKKLLAAEELGLVHVTNRTNQQFCFTLTLLCWIDLLIWQNCRRRDEKHVQQCINYSGWLRGWSAYF